MHDQAEKSGNFFAQPAWRRRIRYGYVDSPFINRGVELARLPMSGSLTGTRRGGLRRFLNASGFLRSAHRTWTQFYRVRVAALYYDRIAAELHELSLDRSHTGNPAVGRDLAASEFNGSSPNKNGSSLPNSFPHWQPTVARGSSSGPSWERGCGKRSPRTTRAGSSFSMHAGWRPTRPSHPFPTSPIWRSTWRSRCAIRSRARSVLRGESTEEGTFRDSFRYPT